MDSIITGKATSVKIPMIQLVDEKTLGGVFGDIPMFIYKAAKLNLTFDCDTTEFGSANETGHFDGTIGKLQRNESDFAVFSVSLESFRGHFDLPVKILNLMGHLDYYILSYPYYNRTESTIHSDIEKSLLAINGDVVALFILLWFLTLAFIAAIHKLFPTSVNVPVRIKYTPRFVLERIEAVKLSEKSSEVSKVKVAWNLFRYILKQGEAMAFVLRSQLLVFTMLAFATGYIIMLLENHMSSDLVTVKKPAFIDTLQDILDAGDEVNVSFLASSNANGVFIHSPKDSLEYQVYQRSLKQWKGVKPNYRTLPGDAMLDSAKLIQRYKLAFLSSDFPSLFILGLECFRPDDHPDSYSNLYRSKESFMFESHVQIARLGIGEEFERRLRKIFTRVMETGLHDLQVTRGHELTLSFNGLTPKLLCLNVKSWSEENDEHTEILELRHCERFFGHIALLFVLVLIVFTMEVRIFNRSQFKNDGRIRGTIKKQKQ